MVILFDNTILCDHTISMKKIPNLFQRDIETGELTHLINPECQWVVDGEGTATRKFDGSSCMLKGNKLYKRRCVKKDKDPPIGFTECTFDEFTGKRYGWVLVEQEDKWHLEAFMQLPLPSPDCTYELCGPKIQGNPEGYNVHRLIPHGRWILLGSPRNPEQMYGYFCLNDMEGIVWWHEDGRKCKLRRGDFKLERL